MNHQENTQGQEKGKGKREVTELNGDMAKTKTGDLEKETRSEKEAEKNLPEEETFKVCCF